MRKYIQIISFLLAAVTLSGCENWLDVKPETEVRMICSIPSKGLWMRCTEYM